MWLWSASRIALISATVLLLTIQSGQAQLASPELGAVNKWVCNGPRMKSYVTKVLALEGGMVRYETQIDGVIGWALQPIGLSGLNLFSSRDSGDDKGEIRQRFDQDDLAAYARLEPGTTINVDVAESDQNKEWDWNYSISIGEPTLITNDLLGVIQVVPVKEKRWIYRQNFSSTYEFLILPERALPVSWTYSDPDGKSACQLYLSYKKKIAN